MIFVLTVNVLVDISSEHHLSDRFANVPLFEQVITVLKYQIKKLKCSVKNIYFYTIVGGTFSLDISIIICSCVLKSVI